MEKGRSDITLLLTVLVLFSASIGFLHGTKAIRKDTVRTYTHPLDEVRRSQALNYLRPLLIARAPSVIAQTLQGVSLARTEELVRAIIKDTASPLNRDEKVLLVLALASALPHDRYAQYRLFNLLRINKIKKGTPPLIIAAHGQYAAIIPVLAGWIRDKNIVDFSPEQALTYAVNENDIEALVTLVKYGVSLHATLATQLLTLVVQQNKDVRFVAFLIDHKADVNYVENKRTLLMYAVQQNNKKMVQTLLNSGAQVDIVLAPQVGSALQIAIEKGYGDIDVLLREYGAKE
jgi:ankyrin repeat protein